MPRQDTVTPYAWLLFALMCAAYLLTPFHRVSPAIMAVDIMRDMALNAPSMGLLASAFFITYGVIQMPGGLLTDGLGPRRLLPPMVALAGVGALLFGFADSLPLAITGRALMGFGLSVIFICGMKLIGVWFPVSQFAKLSGLFLGMGGVGVILASGPLAYACANWGWRMTFWVCGGVTVLLAALLRLVVKDAPNAAPDAAAAPIDWALMGKNTRLVMKNREFWFACLWIFCHFNLTMSFGGLWGGTYLMDVHHLSQTQTGSILNMSGAGVLAGGFLVGWLCALFKSNRKTMICASCVMSVLFALLVFCGESLPLWSLYVWFFLLSAFGIPIHAASFAAMRSIFGIEATGSACGLLNCLPSVGVLLFQPLTGVVLELFPKTAAGAFSPEAYMWGCSLYLAAALIGVAGAWSMREV